MDYATFSHANRTEKGITIMSLRSIYEREIEELKKQILTLERDKADCLESINKIQKRMDEEIKIALSTSNAMRRKAYRALIIRRFSAWRPSSSANFFCMIQLHLVGLRLPNNAR